LRYGAVYPDSSQKLFYESRIPPKWKRDIKRASPGTADRFDPVGRLHKRAAIPDRHCTANVFRHAYPRDYRQPPAIDRSAPDYSPYVHPHTRDGNYAGPSNQGLEYTYLFSNHYRAVPYADIRAIPVCRHPNFVPWAAISSEHTDPAKRCFGSRGRGDCPD
jgi:hypothetical protein